MKCWSSMSNVEKYNIWIYGMFELSLLVAFLLYVLEFVYFMELLHRFVYYGIIIKTYLWQKLFSFGNIFLKIASKLVLPIICGEYIFVCRQSCWYRRSSSPENYMVAVWALQMFLFYTLQSLNFTKYLYLSCDCN